MADDFVDTVISNACKLAKLRESPQLDIRDLQLVLERNYNIRIPGYASDEVRTVRQGGVDRVEQSPLASFRSACNDASRRH